MKDIQSLFSKEICSFCINATCGDCLELQKRKSKGLSTYKCINFRKGKKIVKPFSEYIRYTFYDEVGAYIAIVKPRTPIEVIAKLKEIYDEVKFKE